MIDQTLLDALADGLVERGRQVSYTTLAAELLASRGKVTSDRDIQAPFDDWKRRRRYKAHLAVAKLPEKMEKAIVAFTKQAMRIGKLREAELIEQNNGLRNQVGDLERQLAEAHQRNLELVDRLEAQPPAAPLEPADPVPAVAAVPVPRGRKRGASAATARFFWDYVIRELAVVIRRQGPKRLDELLATIGPQDRELAAAAFRPINAVTLEKALAERTVRQRHGLTLVGDRYAYERPRRRARPGA